MIGTTRRTSQCVMLQASCCPDNSVLNMQAWVFGESHSHDPNDTARGFAAGQRARTVVRLRRMESQSVKEPGSPLCMLVEKQTSCGATCWTRITLRVLSRHRSVRLWKLPLEAQIWPSLACVCLPARFQTTLNKQTVWNVAPFVCMFIKAASLHSPAHYYAWLCPPTFRSANKPHEMECDHQPKHSQRTPSSLGKSLRPTGFPSSQVHGTSI